MYTANVISIGASSVAPQYGGVSLEAQAMLDNYTTYGTALTGDEKSFMIAYVDAEVASGNHALKDYETIYCLSGNNALVDYIGGKVATAVNAPTQSINGFTFDGATQEINTNYNPTLDSINYTVNDCFSGTFVKVKTSTAVRTYFGTLDSAASSRSRLFPLNNWAINSQNARALNGSLNNNDSLYILARNSSTDADFYRNGIAVDTETTNAFGTVLPNSTYYVGNTNGGTYYCDCTLSHFIIGAEIGFNHPDHNTNLRALLTNLGVTL